MSTKARAKARTKPSPSTRTKARSVSRSPSSSRGKAKAPTLELRQRIGLTQEAFSRIVGVKVRTLSKLEKGDKPSDAVGRKLTEVDRLQRALAEVVQESHVGEWMQAPNPAFDGFKPIELIERGEIDRLWGMVYDLRSGSPA